ncbi:MAG: cytochrome c-type biogenesis protein CcmH [Gemmatimonadota bacterium]
MRSRTTGLTMLSAFAAVALAAPLSAQSQASPAERGFDPMHPAGGHYHVGEIGQKWLEVEQSIRCNCSCNLDVHTCQFQMQCDTSPGWSKRMYQELEAGETIEAIQAGFVADFGGTALMSPPAEGFNLVGYFLPSIAIVTAGMLIGLIVRARAGTRDHTAPLRELNEDDALKLRDALRKLDEAEGPDW